MSKFDVYAFNKQPAYEERATRLAFSKAVPLRTVLIYCFDPRAAEIPKAIAAEFGEVWPGEIITNEVGLKVASTTTLFPVVVAGGRAFDALRSVAVAQHLFGIERIIVVHHSWCGATSFSAAGIIAAHAHEHGKDISRAYPTESICIVDFETSLRHDVKELRNSPGTPGHVDIYGYMFDIDTGVLTRVVADKARSLTPS